MKNQKKKIKSIFSFFLLSSVEHQGTAGNIRTLAFQGHRQGKLLKLLLLFSLLLLQR